MDGGEPTQGDQWRGDARREGASLQQREALLDSDPADGLRRL